MGLVLSSAQFVLDQDEARCYHGTIPTSVPSALQSMYLDASH